MQTRLPDDLRRTARGAEADAILRSCVHCGICTASCPTYRLVGDEPDSPRGRIYLIKSLLEGEATGAATQYHLDRCLGCRNCETACPSGVRYGRLLDIGREVLEGRVRRPVYQRLLRWGIRHWIGEPLRFARLIRIVQRLRRVLPQRIRRMLPAPSARVPWPAPRHARRVLILEGCVQPVLAPNINAATARVLDRLGLSAQPAPGCCAALAYHLSASEEAKRLIRRNIDNWWPAVEQGLEAIVVTASGCGTLVKDYGAVLHDDPDYTAKAARIAALARDPCELLSHEDLEPLLAPFINAGPIAFQAPCSLQHGQRLAGVTESLLRRLGFELTLVGDAQTCCGSAGSYSILQPALARRLLRAKIERLEEGRPRLIATANIGCYSFLKTEARVPVKHWIELLDTDTASISAPTPERNTAR
ncbi:MAG: glycolate oxidase subunit GlcF [Gammaproteobacteria bacterium]